LFIQYVESKRFFNIFYVVERKRFFKLNNVLLRVVVSRPEV